MTIRLQDFKSTLKDVARGNRFILQFSGPIIELFENDLQSFIFYVAKASIPKKDITGPILKYRGTSLTLSGDFKRDPLVVTFWNDRESRARSFIENWMNFIVLSTNVDNIKSSNDTFRFGNSAVLKLIGRDEDDIIAAYKFEDITPFEISEIELDIAAENALQDFTSTFHYSFWSRDSSEVATNG